MRREQRLTKRDRFATVYSQGRSWASSIMVLKALPNGLELSRFGFAVGKRVGKAVVRNRVKRLLREGVRQTAIKPGWDMVFIARNPAVSVDYHRLKGAIEELLSQARLLEREEE